MFFFELCYGHPGFVIPSHHLLLVRCDDLPADDDVPLSSVSLGDVGSPVGTVGSLVGTALVGAGDVLSPGLFRPGRGGIGWFRMGGARA